MNLDRHRLARSGPAQDAAGARRLRGLRLVLPLGWALVVVGYFGPWITHQTAALRLTGVDMAEFVKFLPRVQDGSLAGFVRQGFYLPTMAAVASVALLVGSRRVGFPLWARAILVALAVPVSVQVLPPAWSPAALLSTEFRAQTVALGVSWLLLAGSWAWGRLPTWLTSLVVTALAASALAVTTWQVWLVKPAIDEVYARPPAVGWGVFACEIGLAIVASACLSLLLQTVGRRTRARG